MFFDNPGGKIKMVAKVLFIIGIIFSILGWFYFLLESRDAQDNQVFLINISMIVLIAGSISSWLINLFIYGFGSLIENSDILVQNAKNTTLLTKSEPETKSNDTNS